MIWPGMVWLGLAWRQVVLTCKELLNVHCFTVSIRVILHRDALARPVYVECEAWSTSNLRIQSMFVRI